MKIVCKKCGTILDEKEPDTGIFQHVVCCSRCLGKEYDEGFKAGYQRGIEDAPYTKKVE
jgi:hypothetical protein